MMDYKEFDKGSQSSLSELDNKILRALKDEPRTAWGIASWIWNDQEKSYLVSPRLQGLKTKGYISNIRVDGLVYWGLKKLRRSAMTTGERVICFYCGEDIESESHKETCLNWKKTLEKLRQGK